jgi:transaldolase
VKFFLDSAQTDEIAYALEMWGIDGVTTNPRHVQASGKPFLQVVREIAGLFEGTDKPVSVEVNPHHDTWQAMVDDAERNIRVNLTLVFSAAQALQAFRMGAYFVSPFIGWKESNAEEVWGLITDCVAIRDNYAFDGEIIVSAVRNGRQIADAAVVGADIVTAGFAVYRDAFDHPFTHVGLGRFQDFWDQTPYE